MLNHCACFVLVERALTIAGLQCMWGIEFGWKQSIGRSVELWLVMWNLGRVGSTARQSPTLRLLLLPWQSSSLALTLTKRVVFYCPLSRLVLMFTSSSPNAT
jgi:hypothetical protein